MSRLLDKDFSRLEAFLHQYSMADVLKSKTREQLIRRGHKYSLAALQIWASAEKLANSGKLQIHSTKLHLSSPGYAQLSESFSDITSAFFAILHGIYKPAHMSLRSAIETFTRGLASINSTEACNTTNVYRLFELAKTCEPFMSSAAPHFKRMHQEYIVLCDYTHSANPAHLVKNHALSNFPKQDIASLRTWIRHCEEIIKAMLAILVFSNKSLYLVSSPNAQDVYEDTMPKEARLFALGA